MISSLQVSSLRSQHREEGAALLPREERAGETRQPLRELNSGQNIGILKLKGIYLMPVAGCDPRQVAARRQHHGRLQQGHRAPVQHPRL